MPSYVQAVSDEQKSLASQVHDAYQLNRASLMTIAPGSTTRFAGEAFCWRVQVRGDCLRRQRPHRQ